jgi:hypothetical protein
MNRSGCRLRRAWIQCCDQLGGYEVDELMFAATTADAAFLTQASQEGYQRVREAIGRLVRRSGREDEAAAQLERLDRERTAVSQAHAGDRESVVRAAAVAWAPLFLRLAESEPVAYAELLALARQDHPASVVNQHNHGTGTFINGNVEGGLTINHGAGHGRHN